MKAISRSLMLGALLAGAVALQAQEETGGEAPQVAAVSPTESVGNVSFDFKDADLRNVLRLFATKADVNIIAGPEVKGTVTMRLRDVPWEKALELVLEVNGYGYQKEANVIKVLSRAAMAKQPTQTRVFFLNYADAKKLEKSVSHLLSKDGKIRSDDRSNTLVVTDLPTNLAQIDPVVRRLDQQTPQVLVQSMVVETNANANEDIGINWAFLGGDGYRVAIESASATLTHTHSQTRTHTTTKTIQNLNALTTTFSTSEFRFGSATAIGPAAVTATSMTNSRTNVSQLTRNFADSFDDVNIFRRLPNEQRTYTATLSAETLEIFLSFLESTTDTKVLSSPEVLTTNNTTAKILVGEQYPLANYVFNDDTGTLEVQGFTYIDIGIKLFVTPKISPDGYVTLNVKPEIKTRGDSVPFAGSTGTIVPIINTQEAEVNAVVKDRETLVIGGLITDNTSNVVTKLPLLGDIPIIGPRLFSDTSISKDRRNIFIFVTPTIVTSKNAAEVANQRRKILDKHVDFPDKKKSFWSKFGEKGEKREVGLDLDEVYTGQKAGGSSAQ